MATTCHVAVQVNVVVYDHDKVNVNADFGMGTS
jgi:hypothetical protein